MKHVAALVVAGLVWAGSQVVSPQPLPIALCVIAAVVTVYLVPYVWAWSEGPDEASQQRLHAGATAREVEADARLRYWAHTASADEIAERCARLEHPTGRAS